MKRKIILSARSYYDNNNSDKVIAEGREAASDDGIFGIETVFKVQNDYNHIDVKKKVVILMKVISRGLCQTLMKTFKTKLIT